MGSLKGGQDQGGQLVWENSDGTIVPVRLMVDGDKNLVPVPNGPGATEAKQDDLIVLIGEVQPNPTPNTELGRLKDLLTGIILANGNNVIGAVSIDPISGTPLAFTETNFQTGDSPVVLDLNAALGRNARDGFIKNDGPGDFTISFSNDGSAWGDEHTVKRNEVYEFADKDFDSIRVTWVADSAYRVSAI